MWKIVAILLIYFAGQSVTAFVSMDAGDGADIAAKAVTLGRISLAVNAAVILILPAAGLTARRLPAGRPPFCTQGTAVALLATVALTIAVNAAALLLELDDNGTTALFASMTGDPLCLLSLGIVGPLAEETVFRAGLIPAMTRAGLNRWAAAGLAALVFALAHGNAAQGTAAFVMGALFGAFYIATGDIRLPATAHVAVNCMGLAAYLFGDGEDTAVGTASLLACILFFTAAAAGLTTLWARLTFRNNEDTAHRPG